MRHLPVTALAIGVALLLAAGCAPAAQPQPSQAGQTPGDQVKRGGMLVVPLGATGDPPSFDLHQESTSATASSAGSFYDNLIMYDPMKPTEVVPDLGQKWDLSPDGKTYTFTLAKNVKFHNGNPFTSADVKATLERVMKPPKDVKSPRQNALAAITSIDTPDDHTVKLNLKRPSPSLLVNLATGWMAMYDKEWLEAKGQKAPEKETMGTGPYMMKDYIRGTSIEVQKNPNYWVEGKPYLDGVKLLIIPDTGTRMAAMRTGQIMILDVSVSDLAKLQAELGNQIAVQRGVNLGFNSISMNFGRKPFSEPRVQQAVNLAFDRQAALKVLAQEDAEVGGFMQPMGAWALPTEEVLKFPGYGKDKAADLDRAKKLLADAGYPNGFDAIINTRQGQGYEDLTVFTIDQLKKIGINATAKFHETAQAYDLAVKGDFDLLPWTHSAGLDDPDAVYGEFYTCDAPRNYGRLCDKDFDALYEKQSQEVDPAKRKALVWEMEKKGVPMASRIITHWTRFRNVSWSYVRNWVRHPETDNNYRYRDIWLDK